MKGEGAAGKRRYRMQARAAATAATREKILDAVEVAFEELPFGEITLAAIGKRAGVSVQTVLRHFGSRDGLFLASLQHAGAKMLADRGLGPAESLAESVSVLVDHYEEFGDRVLRMLSQEEREPMLRMLAEGGRAFHLQWCKEAFAPALKGLRGAKRERRLAQFVALTDIYVWKLLRRDRGLSQRQTKVALREMLEPLAEPSP
jgi:AcrR family transcriptional regulator